MTMGQQHAEHLCGRLSSNADEGASISGCLYADWHGPSPCNVLRPPLAGMQLVTAVAGSSSNG